jgi:hypothetical protein
LDRSEFFYSASRSADSGTNRQTIRVQDAHILTRAAPP